MFGMDLPLIDTASLPSGIEDLTPSWFTSALGHPVRRLAIEPLQGGLGVLGQLARVNLDDHARLICKWGAPADAVRNIAIGYGFYRTEVNFYRHFNTPHAAIRTPRCHHASVSEDGGRFVLLLEDLAPHVAIDQIVGCPLDRAEDVVDAIAAWHASWWDTEALHELTWLRPLNNSAYKAGQSIYQQVLPMLAAQFGNNLTERGLAIARRVGDRLGALYDLLMQRSPSTIAHADFRLDNILFDLADGSRIAVLDWQFTVRGPGVLDFAVFLGQSLTIELRRQHEADLLRRYHRSLVSHGVVGYSFEQCVQDYRLALAVMLATPVVGSALPVSDQRAQRLFAVMIARALQAAIDNDVEQLI